MKDLRVRFFRRVIALCTALTVIFSGLVSPAHADELSELQDSLKAANSVLAARNSQYSELTQLLQDNVAALDNLNKRIVENQNQTNGAIISIPLDEELQAKKKALEKIILDRSDQSKSIAASISAMTVAINNLKLKIDRAQNGAIVSPEEDPVATPTSNETVKKVTGVSPNCPVGFTQIDAVGNSNGSITITCTTRTEVPKIQQESDTSACSSQAVIIENSYAKTYEALRGFDSAFGSSESAVNLFVGKGIKTVDEANAYFNSNYSYVQSVFTAAAMELKSGKLEPPCLQTGAGKEIFTRVMSGYNTLADLVNSQLTSGKGNLLVAMKSLKLIGTSGGNQAECDNVVNDFISSATGQLQYMDYITSQWSNLDLLLEYATQNRVTTWDQMINIFKGKIEYANQNLGASQSNFYSGKLETVCKGTPSGDQLIAKVEGYFGKGAILNQALTRMDQTISIGFSKFSSVSLVSNVATCTSKFNAYSNSLSAVTSELSAFVAKMKAVGIPSVKLAPDVMNSYLNYSISLDTKLRDVSTSILEDLKKYPDCRDLIKLFQSSEEYLNASSSLQSSIKSSAGPNQNTNLPESSDDPTLDGDEEEPFAKIATKRSSNGIYTISVNSNIEDDDLIIRASKKGSKTIVYKIQTNENGTYSFKTSRNLKGFKLTLYYLGDIFHTVRL